MVRRDLGHDILVSKTSRGINRDLNKVNAAESRLPSLQMPSLFRFLVVVALLGGAVYAGIAALGNYVQPQPREITVNISPDKFVRNR
jgi:hypothetical protein